MPPGSTMSFNVQESCTSSLSCSARLHADGSESAMQGEDEFGLGASRRDLQPPFLDLDSLFRRTGCDFSDSSKPDYAQCESGGCKGGLLCTGAFIALGQPFTTSEDIRSRPTIPSPPFSSAHEHRVRCPSVYTRRVQHPGNDRSLCVPLEAASPLPSSRAIWQRPLMARRLNTDDSSLVDGYNVPMAITNSADCPMANW